MTGTVLEELIKNIFGSNWLISAGIILISFFVIKSIYKRSLPQYIKSWLIVAIGSLALLLLLICYPSTNQSKILTEVLKYKWVFAGIAIFAIIFLLLRYRKINKQLNLVVKNIKTERKSIAAWKDLQNIKESNLTPLQQKKYDKHKLYLRVFLGNTSGAEIELEKYKEDKPFYHYMKAIILNFKGNHKDEYGEIKLAEDSCTGDTDPLLHFQIILNRGVSYEIAGEYALANDCYKKAIVFGSEHFLKNAELWLTTYYDYVFNMTRIEPDISLQKCLDILENVKEQIDIEDPKQYIGLSNIIIEIMRQKNAERSKIDEFINSDFEYIVNQNLSNTEKCVFEATTARMVCTGRLTPEIVIERLTEDINLFLELPMPEKYRCFKEIDYMFKDLRGPIVDANQQIKETAHWYMVNRAIYDLDEYRASLPSEAVYEICYCLKERSGLLKNIPDQYKWEEFFKNMQSAQLLYQENGLLADVAMCYLDVMDEATAELNLDSEQKPLHLDVLENSLKEVEKILPLLVNHPILYEIYLRLSMYCLVMNDIPRSKDYYKKYRTLGAFPINHFAPWLRSIYSIISLIMIVIGYIETVDKIAKKDLSAEALQVQDWFKGFHDRNGYFEAIVFGRVLGGEIIPMCIEQIVGKLPNISQIKVCDIQNTWLVIPALSLKIKCNGTVDGKAIGTDGILSDYTNDGMLFCNVNTIMPEQRDIIEHIVDMIKAEMPEYLISMEELNMLASENWFNVVPEETC